MVLWNLNVSNINIYKKDFLFNFLLNNDIRREGLLHFHLAVRQKRQQDCFLFLLQKKAGWSKITGVRIAESLVQISIAGAVARVILLLFKWLAAIAVGVWGHENQSAGEDAPSFGMWLVEYTYRVLVLTSRTLTFACDPTTYRSQQFFDGLAIRGVVAFRDRFFFSF